MEGKEQIVCTTAADNKKSRNGKNSLEESSTLEFKYTMSLLLNEQVSSFVVVESGYLFARFILFKGELICVLG